MCWHTYNAIKILLDMCFIFTVFILHANEMVQNGQGAKAQFHPVLNWRIISQLT